MFSYFGKRHIYHNKQLRDYVLKSTNDSIKKIVEKKENTNYLSDDLIIYPEKKYYLVLPFCIFLYISFSIYSNKKISFLSINI